MIIKKNRNAKILILTAVIFMILFATGINLSLKKWLWNDELYAQTDTMQKLTYQDIFLSRITKANKLEANACPLYFLVQKAIMDIFHYEFNLDWTGEWSVPEPRGQIILRINPNLFMSLSLAAIFYFFARYYSLGFGFYALFIALTSMPVLVFWIEAKHYAMWFFGTTAQFLLFIFLVHKRRLEGRSYYLLMASHIFLSLTTVLSVITIVVVSFVLWLFVDRRWTKYIGLTLVPFGFCLFYFFQARRYTYIMNMSPYHFLELVFSPGRLVFFAGSLGVGLLFMIMKRIKMPGRKKRDGVSGINEAPSSKNFLWMDTRKLNKGYWACLVMTGLILASYFALFYYLAWTGRNGQFYSTYRFFIYLTPVSIIATAYFTIRLLDILKGHRWLLINLIVGLVGMLVIDTMLFIREFLSFSSF